MDLKIKPDKEEIINYNIGIIKLKKDIEYIANYHWVNHLECKKEEFKTLNYNISIDASNKSILISRPIGLGDILFLTPVLKHIKKIYPTCKIGFATANCQHELLKYILEIDEIIDYPIEYEIYKTYDYHFSVSGVIEGSNNINNIYYEYMNHLGVKNINELDLIPSLKFKFSSNKDSNIIGIHPFSGDSMRQLNLHNIANLCNDFINLGYEISIFSNKYEYDKFYKLFPDKVNWVSKIESSVINTINELNRCKDIICGDSFITHLCQAINVKCIAIYGPFSPNCRVSTYSNITIIDTNPDCRCFKHQLNKCPKGIIPSPCINIDNNILINLIKNQDYIINEINISDPIINKYNWRENV